MKKECFSTSKRLLPSVKRSMVDDIVERDFLVRSNNEILAIAKLAYKDQLGHMPDSVLADRYCDAFNITGEPTYIEVVGVREA